MYHRLSLFLVASVAAQTKDSCIPGRHFNDDDGYFVAGVGGLSTDVDLDSAHGQKAPNSTWAAGLTYPAGEYEILTGRVPENCKVAPGCRQYYSLHTCSQLQFCNAPGDMEGQDVYQLPTQEALDACDFSEAILVGNTASADSRRRELTHSAKRDLQESSLCYEFPFEVDHELTNYFFSSQENCAAGQKIAVQINDYDETADACYRIGETTGRLRNCDCRLEKKPSTLGEPCRTEFSDRCFEIMQVDRPDDGCCEREDCISTLDDFSHPDGNAKELARRDSCDDSVPGLCYNEDGLGTDTNRLGSTNCCSRTCTECGTALGPYVLWKPCENLDGTTADCGLLSRYDRAPFQCDFSLCEDEETWNVDKCPFISWSGGECGGISICFAGDNEVVVNGTPTKMKNLKIGDEVMVDEHGNYGKVYSFGHMLENTKAEYNEIQSKGKPSLIMSNDHMVFVEKDGERKAVRAEDVKEGDSLITVNDSFIVSRITKTKKAGAYAPFTESGTIVVNGIVSSCYVAMQKTELLFGLFSHQSVAHFFESPHRLYCNYLSDCQNEEYNEEGISTWVAAPLEVANWLMKSNTVVQVSVITPAAMILSLFNLLEGFVGVATVMPKMVMAFFGLLAFRKYLSAQKIR
jgi:hypothetical protein